MRLVAPWGFYGMGNIGDEGTLCGFARLLSLHDVRAHVTVASSNATHNSQVEPAFSYYSTSRKDLRRFWAKFRGHAHAVIGGTPIMDILGDWPLREVGPLVQASERWNVPFVFIGSGVEKLRSDDSRRIVREQVAPRVRHWSVRSDRDRDRLIEYGVAPTAVTTAADLAWLIEPVAPDFGRERLNRLHVPVGQPIVGVNVSNENLCFDRHPETAAALAAALDALVEDRGASILFFCSEVREGETYDKAATRRILSHMKRPDRTFVLPNEYFSPRELMSLISCCQLIVSMRYHVCLFSALQSVPFVAIERADKVEDLCWDLGWAARVKPPGFLSAELLEHAGPLLDDPAPAVAHLRRRTAELRARAAGNTMTLRALGLETAPVGAQA